MCGSATLAIVLSSVWISVASMIDRVSIGRFSGRGDAVAAGFKEVSPWGGRRGRRSVCVKL
ncbi:hypothetical protein FEP76_05390 [Burkholderia multivorans]|nr:hypothetical protein [Burkholderia multivorans]